MIVWGDRIGKGRLESACQLVLACTLVHWRIAEMCKPIPGCIFEKRVLIKQLDELVISQESCGNMKLTAEHELHVCQGSQTQVVVSFLRVEREFGIFAVAEVRDRGGKIAQMVTYRQRSES